MNKLWQSKLQSSFRDTFTDGAARIKQGWALSGDRPAQVPEGSGLSASGPAPGKGPQPQYLRLPIDSARKLRWYDREDLSRLIESNLQERQQLAEVNTALREVLSVNGISEEQLDAELQARIEEADRARYFQEAVHSVLLASAQAEVEHLRQELADSAQQISQLQSRLAHLDMPEVTSSAASPAQPQHRRQASADSEHSSLFPPSRAESVTGQSITAAPQSSMPEQSSNPSPRPSDAGHGDYPAASGSATTSVDQSPAMLHVPPQAGFAAPDAQSAAAADSPANLESPNASPEPEPSVQASELEIPAQQMLPEAAQHSAQLDRGDMDVANSQSFTEARSGVQRSLEAEPDGGSSQKAELKVAFKHQESSNDSGPEQPLTPQQQQPARDKGNTVDDSHLVALMGKLQRLEEERQGLLEHSTSNAERTATLEAQLQMSESQLSSIRQTLAESREVAERQLQEVRSKLANCQNQQAEMLRRAQDICLSAEDRAEKADTRLEKIQAQVNRLETELRDSRAEAKRLTTDLRSREKDVQTREKESERISSRAAQAEAALAEAKQAGRAEAEKGANVTTLLGNARRAADEREAELRKAMRDGEAKLQTRNTQLEADIASLRSSVERLEAEVEALDRRATEAETAEAELLQELRQIEAIAADRDLLAARATALEERLEEGRAEKGQVASLRQLAAEAEAARARVEEEVLATARIATGLEARLSAARAEADFALREALAANERCTQAEARVETEVERRLQACAAQRSLWPIPAQEEVDRLEVRAQGLQSMLAALQEDVDDATALRQKTEITADALQAKACAAEERVTRLERENKETADRLHRQVSAAKAEVKEWKREARAAEEERQRWGPATALNPPIPPASPSFSPINGSARPRLGRGGGGLHGLTVGGLGDREAMNGVDMLYLKNVLLKFVEAHALGRLAERDALVPAIATLLRATPAEFRALRVAMSQANPTWWIGKA